MCRLSNLPGVTQLVVGSGDLNPAAWTLRQRMARVRPPQAQRYTGHLP